LVRSKQEYLKCKNKDTEECNEIRTKARAEAGEFLLRSVELVLNHIERVRERVNSNEDLSEEEANEILENLDEAEKEIQEAKEIIENLSEDSSKEEIKEAAKTIRDAWRKIKKDFKHDIGRTLGARLRTIIAKSEISGERLDNTIKDLKAEGKDTSELEELIGKYHDYVDDAIEKYELARDKWEEATTPGNVDEISREANALFKEANEALKNAHRLLKEIVKDIKEQGTSINGDDKEDNDAESNDGEAENEHTESNNEETEEEADDDNKDNE